jgi:hypothetical protein
MAELMTEEAEIEQARAENGNHSRSAVQKRIDGLTGEKYRLRQENKELLRENAALRAGLERALQLIDKVRKNKCQRNSK